jgi:lipopolysaccharide transport system ATP-binding protein
MEAGKIVLAAKPRQVIELYEARLLKRLDTQPDRVEVKVTAKPGEADPVEIDRYTFGQVSQVAINSSEVQIKTVRFLDQDDREVQSVISNQMVQLAISLVFLEQFDDPHIGFKIRNRTGEVIFETNTACMKQAIGPVERNTPLEVRFQFAVPLSEGEYTVTVGVSDSAFGEGQFKRTLVYLHDTAILKVLHNKEAALWAGLVNLNPLVTISREAYV